jgi:Zn-finger nucleic acid-binding protein
MMNCPVCKTPPLATAILEPGFVANFCESCGGHWISNSQYWGWRNQQGANLPELPASGPAIRNIEMEAARLCPQCKRILIKYRVGHNVPFTLDNCGNCGGVWLDHNEWATLKTRNLHDDLYAIFTEQWQDEARREESRQHLAEMYERRFGAADYAELKRIRAWIDEHTHKQEILAYLNDAAPLDV